MERQLAADLKEAQALILAGEVLLDRQRIDKPGALVACEGRLELKTQPSKYVSRGGEKLEGALKQLKIEVAGMTCLDLGASTGGFTDCLLQAGAQRVYAFDVGKGQMDWRLRQDSRVEVRESVNVRYLEAAQIETPVDLIVADLAYISLRLVLPGLKDFQGARILVLVKPQFEGRRSEVEAGGVVRDEGLRSEIVDRIARFARRQGFRVLGQADSPLRGRKGNLETFLYLEIRPDNPTR